MSPKVQKALFVVSKGGEFAVQDTAVPSPGPGEILARVDATALNPVDWKIKYLYQDLIQYPGILGSDGAGVVVEIGDGVTGWKKGDKM